MKTKLNPEIRREVIQATGLCKNLNCVAHDDLVEKIWAYKCNAEDRGYEDGQAHSHPPYGLES